MGKRRGAGDGALHKHAGGIWEGRVDIPPGPDGKRRTRSVYAKDRSACADKLRKLQDEVNAGLVSSAPATTVGDWLDYWLANIHRIAITQTNHDGPGRTYYQRRLAAGDSRHRALRSLKRRLARVVFNRLKACPPAVDDLSSNGHTLPNVFLLPIVDYRAVR